ncbi:MAG: hypothetical protein HN712_23130 [Gemmatimonadetes bacterium]|jgi:hypothetical protein|nr:hypothetical protein [Gemmatimonadota bacterium]MBT6149351.1 hypothetical protein [Gemmatimonadota bacterium]MBT7863228.1 hypothetical protein [Gemmatimonadota bacterium]
MSTGSIMSAVVRRGLTWMGRGLIFGIAATGLVVGGAIGQLVVAYVLG